MAKSFGYFGFKFSCSVTNQPFSNVIRNISFFKSKKVSWIIHLKFIQRVSQKSGETEVLCILQKKKSPYVILRPTKDEYCDILDLMWKSFHNEEPVSKTLEIGSTANPAIDEKTLEIISQGLSYVAKCKYTGCIVGASLNESTCFWDADQTDKFACSLSCKKTRDMYQFWAYLQRHPKIFEKYCVDNVFEVFLFIYQSTTKNTKICLNLNYNKVQVL